MPIIRIEMLSGRTAQQKRDLVEALTRETARVAKCAVEGVQVVIAEVEREHWATGGVLASEAAKK
jgi:4-oxalocrotonate tautomerase